MVLMRFKAFVFLNLFVGAILAGQSPPQRIDIHFAGKRPPRVFDKDELRVLFVGNSLTYFNEMPWLAEQVAESLQAKPRLRATFIGRSGATLRNHWDEEDTLREIREGRYRYVVLQPQGTEIIRTPEETARFATLFDAEIRKTGARTVIFLSWAPRTGDQPQSVYTERYLELASKLGAVIAPVGIAWTQLRGSDIELYDEGGHHPNLSGSYLIACVFYSTLYGRSPVNAVHKFNVHFEIPEFYRYGLEHERLDPSTASAIQSAAWHAAQTFQAEPQRLRFK